MVLPKPLKPPKLSVWAGAAETHGIVGEREKVLAVAAADFDPAGKLCTDEPNTGGDDEAATVFPAWLFVDAIPETGVAVIVAEKNLVRPKMLVVLVVALASCMLDAVDALTMPVPEEGAFGLVSDVELPTTFGVLAAVDQKCFLSLAVLYHDCLLQRSMRSHFHSPYQK